MSSTSSNGEGFEGFVSSSKGITLSIVSLGVWGFTLIFYKMTLAVTGNVNYENFCLFCSFFLSLLLGIMISKNIYSRKDKLRTLAIMLNILLIYTSANGIQAGNAAFSRPDSSESGSGGSSMALFGLLDVRPWLPDATSKMKIDSLTEENYQIKMQLEKTGNITVVDNNEEIIKLRNENNALKRQLDSLRSVASNSNNYEQLQSELFNLRNRLNNYTNQLQEFNELRGQWNRRIDSDFRFRSVADTFQLRLRSFDFGNNYLNRVFNYNLMP